MEKKRFVKVILVGIILIAISIFMLAMSGFFLMAPSIPKEAKFEQLARNPHYQELQITTVEQFDMWMIKRGKNTALQAVIIFVFGAGYLIYNFTRRKVKEQFK